jgi:BTB/POZ domain
VQHLLILAHQVSTDFPQDLVLPDLRETYGWLNAHSEDAGEHMIQYWRTHKLFLNVADPEVMIWEWYSAGELLLGAKETMGNFHPVQKFLLSFKNLLEVSGVQPLTDATLPERSDSSSEISLQSIRSAFCLMRRKCELTDVLFIPDTGDDEQGNVFYAHCAYLATCSDYFKDLFTSGYKESLATSINNPVEVRVVGHSSHCVEIVLGKSHFLYRLKCTWD